jgi:hypothetical protein
MSRKQQVLELAERLQAVHNELREAGHSSSSSIHGVDRETFDQIPGEERLTSASWWKGPQDVTFFCNESPRLAPAEELAQLEREIAERQARARELRGES